MPLRRSRRRWEWEGWRERERERALNNYESRELNLLGVNLKSGQWWVVWVVCEREREGEKETAYFPRVVPYSLLCEYEEIRAQSNIMSVSKPIWRADPSNLPWRPHLPSSWLILLNKSIALYWPIHSRRSLYPAWFHPSVLANIVLSASQSVKSNPQVQFHGNTKTHLACCNLFKENLCNIFKYHIYRQ